MFWGIRGNYRSIPTDCPQRDERQGWLGDRSQVSRSEAYMFDVAAFYTKWMTDLADSQKPDGSIPVVSPNYWPNYNDDLTWPSTFLFVPGMLYDQYGDRRAMERNYPAMKKWIDHEAGFLQGRPDAQGSIRRLVRAAGGSQADPFEGSRAHHRSDAAGTAYYYQLLRTMARYARMLDKPADAADFDKRCRTRERRVPRSAFFKPANGIYDNGTQTSSILPLYFDMVPPENRAAVFESLVRNIERTSNGHVGTGLVGAQWLMRTLTDNGRADLAYKIATAEDLPRLGLHGREGRHHDLGIVERRHRRPRHEFRQPRDADRRPGRLDVRVPGRHPFQPRAARLPAHHHPPVSGRRSDVREGVAQVDVRHDRDFMEARRRPLHAGGDDPAQHQRPGVDARQGRRLGDRIRPPGVKSLRIEPGAAIYEVPSGTYTFVSTL